jgi:hypothetical protein
MKYLLQSKGTIFMFLIKNKLNLLVVLVLLNVIAISPILGFQQPIVSQQQLSSTPSKNSQENTPAKPAGKNEPATPVQKVSKSNQSSASTQDTSLPQAYFYSTFFNQLIDLKRMARENGTEFNFYEKTAKLNEAEATILVEIASSYVEEHLAHKRKYAEIVKANPDKMIPIEGTSLFMLPDEFAWISKEDDLIPVRAWNNLQLKLGKETFERLQKVIQNNLFIIRDSYLNYIGTVPSEKK